MTANTHGSKHKGTKGWGTTLRQERVNTTWRALWIQQLYQVFLGRSASATELLRHEDQIAAGLDPAELPRALATSREGRNRTIHALYRRYLGRAADPVGLTHYRKALARGRTRVEIERDLLVSAEYATVQGGTLPGWLRGLYQDVYMRVPDAAGFEYFAHDLAQASGSKAAVALIFLDSHERREGWIRASFVEVLSRAPSPDELSSWLRVLAAGTDLDEIRYALAASLAAPSACVGPRLGSAEPTSWSSARVPVALARRSATWGGHCRAESA